MRTYKATMAASILALASASDVRAQAISGTPVELPAQRVIDNSLPVSNPEAAPLPDLTIDFPTQQPPANAATLNFVLKNVAVGGAKLLPAEDLRPLYADLIGKEITLLQAFGVIEEMQAEFRDAGYIFTRVIAPPQTIENGIFQVRIVEAAIGQVVIEQPEGDVGPPLPLIEQMAARLEGLENPTVAELERVLLLLNDIPGVTQATAVPRPGKGLGTVDVYINVVRDKFSGVFFADNRQSPILGSGLAGVSVEASSYSSKADTTIVSLFNSFGDQLEDDLKERNTLQVEHQRHIGTNGTVLKTRGLVSRTAPGDRLTPLDLEGFQVNVELGVEHPFVRTRPLSLWGYAGLELDDNELDQAGGSQTVIDDKVRLIKIGARLLQRDDYGYTQANAEIRQGLPIFGASDTDDALRSRPDGVADFLLIRGSLERELFIPGTDKSFSLYGLALGQYAFDPLLSTQEFSIGGARIGRAYDPSEYSADNGYGLVGEIRFQTSFEPQGALIGVQVYGYGDFASVSSVDDGSPDQESLASFGGGIRLNLPQQINLTGEVAVPTEALQRNKSDDPRFFFNLVKRF